MRVTASQSAASVVEVVGVDAVGAVAAAHRVGEAVAHADVVVARAGVDLVDARAAGHDVGAAAGGIAVVAGAAVDRVGDVAGRQRVRAVAAEHLGGHAGRDGRGVLAVAEVDPHARDARGGTEGLDQARWRRRSSRPGRTCRCPAPGRRSGRGTRSGRRCGVTVSVFSETSSSET